MKSANMLRWLTVAICLALLPASCSAQVWVEVGDAGELPATHQEPAGTGPLLAIEGEVSNLRDSDLYCIFIRDPASFSASTINAFGTLVDTQISLFRLDGIGIAMNDDGGGTELRAELTGIPGLTQGEYLLGVSAFDRDPMSADGLIFDNTPFVALQLPIAPGGNKPLSQWTDTGFATGTYRVDLVGVEFCPEPSTYALIVGALIPAVALARRRRT
jgi:hypothetical protein